VGYTLYYYIICVLLIKVMTKGKGDYIYWKNDNKYNINDNKINK
jgi:hypothetical protein